MQNLNQNEIVCFTMPKKGEQEADNQDAYCYSNDRTMVAIADGASTSLFPKEWATFLVEDFCYHQQGSVENLYRNWKQWLDPLQRKWISYSNKIKQDSSIPWYVKGSQEKNSASATFIGLKLHPPNQAGQNIWQAITIGDSCLFQFKKLSGEIIFFPIKKSSDFTTVTECFNSLPKDKGPEPKYWQNDYNNGDIFLLATDALAEWILQAIQSAKREDQNLISIAEKQEFEDFIQNLRHNKLIKNDDTTLCRLTVGANIQQLTTKSQHNNIEYSSQNLQQNQKQISEFPFPPTPSVQQENFNPLAQTYDHTNARSREQSIQQHPIVYETSNQSPVGLTTTSISNTENGENRRLSKDRKLKIIEFLILIGVLGVVVITILSWFLVRENRKTSETKAQNEIVDKSNNKFSNTSKDNEINNNVKSPQNITDNRSNLEPSQVTQAEFETPIYPPKGYNSEAIGFLYAKQDDQLKDELDLWVLIPNKYLRDSKQPLIINVPEGIRAPLFQKIQEKREDYFLGILFPGIYEVFEPKKPQNPLGDSRWVKVKVKLQN